MHQIVTVLAWIAMIGFVACWIVVVVLNAFEDEARGRFHDDSAGDGEQ